MQPLLRTIVLGAAIIVGNSSCIAADEVAAFYKGKTVSIVVGNEPNTGFDVYARVLARHLGRHLPGQPHLVVQNMVGASGIVAANWLYNVAPRDGTVIATFVHTVPFEPLMGNAAAKYDAEQFAWVGNMELIIGVCAVSKASGIEKFDQLFEKETVFGATGATGAVAKYALAIKNLLGAKIRLVAGYKGTASIKLAMQQGEVGGLVRAWHVDGDFGLAERVRCRDHPSDRTDRRRQASLARRHSPHRQLCQVRGRSRGVPADLWHP